MCIFLEGISSFYILYIQLLITDKYIDTKRYVHTAKNIDPQTYTYTQNHTCKPGIILSPYRFNIQDCVSK